MWYTKSKQVQSKNFVQNETIWFITVPAFQNLFCTHDVFLGHYRRYDNQMLISHTEKANLKTLDVGYFFMSLLLPRYLQVKKEKSNQSLPATTGLNIMEVLSLRN